MIIYSVARDCCQYFICGWQTCYLQIVVFWISYFCGFLLPSTIHLGILCGSFNISLNASNNCLCIDVRYFSQKLWTLSAPGVFQLWENLITVVISFISNFFHSGLFISLYNVSSTSIQFASKLPCSYLSVKYFGIIFECSYFGGIDHFFCCIFSIFEL